jgi:hypothetical protein
VEFDWRGLQRLLLWDTFNQLDIGCLCGATRGTFASKRYCDGDQHGGFDQIRDRKRHYYAWGCRHCGAS